MKITETKINGDFRSEDCTSLLKESDIVVTNPPFSLFRDFFKWLMDNEKKFLIIGNKNAITYKEIFPYLKDNKVWLGCTSPKDFYQPDTDNPKTMAGLTRWFTNLEHNKRREPLLITEKYSSDKYPKYDNYDAIEVSKVNKIPYDYNGVMGVPITYMDNHNPDQFEIVGFSLLDCKPIVECISSTDTYDKGGLACYLTINQTHHKRLYARIFIRRRINK